MDWTHLLDPANGGPGESPGYREAIESLRANPPTPKVKRKAAAKKTKPAKFPSAKHASAD